MGTDPQKTRATDRISGLSGDLLCSILLRLPDTAEAARTSILSRRWRHVWTHLPELSFCYQNEPVSAAQAHGRVDAALAAHSAANVTRLEITIPHGSPGIHTDRVAPWLRFASERLAGELSLSLPYNNAAHEEEELLLPPCEKLAVIRFDLNRTLRFQLPPTGGAFMALATLNIKSARMDGRELECFLSTCCPRLKELVLEWITLKDGARVLSIRSDSLRRLATIGMGGFEGQLQIVTPELESFSPYSLRNFYIAAPNLSEVIWYSPSYDPVTRHHFAEPGRHLRRLVTSANHAAGALMRRFSTVEELNVTVSIAEGRQEYESYLEHINNLSKCQVLVVKFTLIEHSLVPTVLHLLVKCVGITKLVVHLSYSTEDYPSCKSSGCPCGWQEKTNNIALDSLEEIEVKGYDSDRKVELVRLLCRCSTMFGKKVSITVHTQSGYMRAKINKSIRARNNKVELTVR